MSRLGGIDAVGQLFWHLRADAEMMKIDIADAKMVTLGLEYRLKN